MNSEVWNLMLQESGNWHLLAALVCGVVVGIVYFNMLRWSITHMSNRKHKFAFFAIVALCRIAIFFGVLILLAGKNKDIAAIVLYVVAFFISKVVIVWREKKKHGFLAGFNKEDKSNAA